MSVSEETNQRCRQLLLDMRQELLDQVQAQRQLSRDRDHHRGDLGDYATIEMAAEYAHLLCYRLRARLLLIDEALDAIENGEYGICDDCEEPINEKRLLLMPFTRFCVGCQSKLERQARIRGHLSA